MKRNVITAFALSFIVGISVIAPILHGNGFNLKNTTVLSYVKTEKTETFHLTYAPTGELLSKTMEATISIKNKGNEPVVINITDRVRGIDINNIQFLYGKKGVIIPFPDAESPEFYYIRWESVIVPARNKTLIGYAATVTMEAPANISVAYKVNNTQVVPIYENGLYSLYAPMSSKITIDLNVTNRLKQVYTPNGLVRPPALALITMMFDATSLEEPIARPAPVFSLQTSGMLTEAWAATFGLDINALQGMNLSISGLEIDPNMLPDFIGIDMPFELEVNTTVVGNGSWGFVKLPSISITLAVDMSMLGPTIDSVVQLMDGMETALYGVSYLLNYYASMFNSSIDYILDAFVRWNSLLSERDIFAKIIAEGTNIPINIRTAQLRNATASTVIGIMSSDIALNGIPPNETWRNMSYANRSCTYYNVTLNTDTLQWFNISTKLEVNPSNNHTEIRFLSKIYFDKYSNNASVIFREGDIIIGLNDSPFIRIYDYNIPEVPLLDIATIGVRHIIWRVLPDASHSSYDYEAYMRINGTIDITRLMEIYGGNEANATEVSEALHQFGVPGLYNFSQLLMNLSEYIHGQNLRLKTLRDIGKHQRPLFGYFSLQNVSGNVGLNLENISMYSDSGLWIVHSINVSLDGPVNNGTVNAVVLSIPRNLNEDQIWARINTTQGTINVSYGNLTYLGFNIDLEKGRLILYPGINISKNETLNILRDWNGTPVELVLNVSAQPTISIIVSDVIPIYEDVDNRGIMSAVSTVIKEVSIKTREFKLPPIYVHTPPPQELPWELIFAIVAAAVIAAGIVIHGLRKRSKTLRGLDIALRWLNTRRTYWETQKIEVPVDVLEEYRKRVEREVNLFNIKMKRRRKT